MKFRRFMSLFLVCAVAVGALTVPTSAHSTDTISLSELASEPLAGYEIESPGSGAVSRASRSLNMTVSANKTKLTTPSLSLGAGDTVTIDCSYSPASASMDFGLVAPNDRFYYINVTEGSIDETIQVEEHGSYTLAVRNNSDSAVTVIGTVNY